MVVGKVDRLVDLMVDMLAVSMEKMKVDRKGMMKDVWMAAQMEQ
jgi:hypothetical protein